GALGDYLPLRLQALENHEDRRLFQQYLQRYHYLGYRVPYGAQLRYFCSLAATALSAAGLLAVHQRGVEHGQARRLHHVNPVLLETLVEEALRDRQAFNRHLDPVRDSEWVV